MPKDEPRAPAAAYWAVSQSLPAAYFTVAPPAVGVRVIATHSQDHVATEWCMSEPQANALVPRLRNVHGMRVSVSAYPAKGS